VPDDRSEQVLHGAGHGHHLVGLQLREVDDPVRLQVGAGEFQSPEQPCPGNFHSVREFGERRAGLLADLEEPRPRGHLAEVADAGGIPHERDTSGPLDEIDRCAQHRRVGGDRLLGILCRQHVRLEENPFAGSDECIHSAERLQKPDERTLYPFRFIVRASFDADGVHDRIVGPATMNVKGFWKKG